jgi:hypothetical protein
MAGSGGGNGGGAQAPLWWTIASALLALTSTLFAAGITHFGNLRVGELEAKVNEARVAAEIQAQQAQQAAAYQTRRDAHLVAYVPKLMASSEHDRLEAVVLLSVLYNADDAADIVGRVDGLLKATGGNGSASGAPLPAASAPTATTASGNLLPSFPTPAASPTAASPTATPASDAQPAAPAPAPTKPSQATATATPRAVEPSRAAAVAEVLRSAPAEHWSVVIGSDTDRSGAEGEVTRVAKLGYDQIAVYRRGSLFATTVGDFPSQRAADNAVIALRARVRYSSFVVKLATWCPGAEKDQVGSETANGSKYDFYRCPEAAIAASTDGGPRAGAPPGKS